MLGITAEERRQGRTEEEMAGLEKLNINQEERQAGCSCP